ncbi:MAG TPA: glycosyltransferase family 4 protein [Candidatus Paceibacterota bacterium]|nr:glycosyltransferase family 4 protein [Candidatus Paceibacterota bacterium]
MKILLATPLYPPDSGGPSTYAKMLVDELPKRGIEVVLLKFGEVHNLPPVVRHIVYFFKCISRAWGVDAIYALDTMSVGWPAFFASVCAWKKFVVRVPGDHIWEQGAQRFGITASLDEMQRFSLRWHPYLLFLRVLQHFVIRFANVVVTPSEYMKKIVISWGARPERVQVIYSSVHLPVAFTLPSKRPEGFLVVTIARRVPWKGIEALERVVARESGWAFKLIVDLPHVEAMGWVKAADVFALNSTYEGLSHALVEAMALGTSVVATNVGGNPELVTSGKNGLLIPPKDDEALYAALKNIETHPEEARKRVEHAKEYTQQFSIDITIEKLVNLLKTI